MNKYRQALLICLAGGLAMVFSMIFSGNSMSASIISGFATVIIALVGLHLGIWTVRNPQEVQIEKKAIFVLRFWGKHTGLCLFANETVIYPEGGLTEDFVEKKMHIFNKMCSRNYELHNIIRLD